MKHALALCLSLLFLAPAAEAGKPAKKREPNASVAILAAVIQGEEEIEVWLNPKKHWQDHKNLTAHYTEAEERAVEKITEAAKLCNLSESVYGPCPQGRTVAQVKADVLRAGAQFEQGFQAFADRGGR